MRLVSQRSLGLCRFVLVFLLPSPTACLQRPFLLQSCNMRSTHGSLSTVKTDRAWVILAAIATLIVLLTTLQWDINGSQSPYATDVGEIQNALPRWGTIHFTGYPLYTFTGSLWVTFLRVLGIQPAAGASLFSALWAVVSAALLVALALALGVPAPMAVVASLITTLSTSTWVYSSLAEIHTMTMVFTLATLLFAVRFGRSGAKPDLLALTLFFTQGVAHQRANVLLAPAVILLIIPKIGVIRRHPLPVLGVAVLAPLTYLYLPLRAWQGAKWTFSEPGTWHGFWALATDTKASRVVEVPTDLAQWLIKVKETAQLLSDDLPIPLLVIALGGVVLLASCGQRRQSLSLLLTALPYWALALVIWEGQVSDALLAVKLPVIYVAGLGLALAAGEAGRRWPRLGTGLLVCLIAVCAALFLTHRPRVLAITRDPAAEEVIATVEQLSLQSDRPTTFTALWGHDYWALAYAQTYRHHLPGLTIVDHNADFRRIVQGGGRLLTLERTFYQRPLPWWENQLGTVCLTSAGLGVVEIAQKPPLSPSDLPPGSPFDLGNGITIASAHLERCPDELRLVVYWQAEQAIDRDYSVGVHLVAHDPPRGPKDMLQQADSRHPVYGWYPTSRWQVGEIVRDDYLIQIPLGGQPTAVRLGMYLVDSQGQFVNTEWLSLPVPVAEAANTPLAVGT